MDRAEDFVPHDLRAAVRAAADLWAVEDLPAADTDPRHLHHLRVRHTDPRLLRVMAVGTEHRLLHPEAVTDAAGEGA